MSNGPVFDYTEKEKAVLLDQFDKVHALRLERKRPASVISAALQALICDDNIVVAPKVEMKGDDKIYHVVANFANATEAVNLGDYPVKWGYADGKMGEVPIVVQPVNQRMRIVTPGRVVYNRELPELLPNLVSPIAALGFGFKFPEPQRNQPLVTVWRDAQGRFWCVCLRVNGDQRGVSVARLEPVGNWNGSVGFLVGE